MDNTRKEFQLTSLAPLPQKEPRKFIAATARAILFWLPLPLIAIINGSLRDLGYGSYFGGIIAHQISTATLIIFLTIYLAAVNYRWDIRTKREAFLIGGIWLLLTLAFEFGAGHFAFGKPWEVLLEDYNILSGRLWIFIPIWSAIAPYLIFRYSDWSD